MTPLPRVRVLLVEKSSQDAVRIEKTLCKARSPSFEVETAVTLDEALALLSRNDFDAVLMNLDLPDSRGLNTFTNVYSKFNDVPIIIISGSEDMSMSLNAVRQGAQDYLLKSDMQPRILSRVIRYAIQRQLSDKALRESAEQFRTIVSNIPGAIYRYRFDSWKSLKMEYVSDVIKNITGYSVSDLTRDKFHSYRKIILVEDAEKVVKTIESAAKNGQAFTVDYRIRHADGSVRWVHDQGRIIRDQQGKILCIDGAIFDTTVHRQAEERIKYLAYHDSLTNLPNRLMFIERLDKALRIAEKKKRLVGILFIGLDHFKRVNDTLGHMVGDVLLKNVAERFKQVFQGRYYLARTGSDEFAVMLTSLQTTDEVSKIAGLFSNSLKNPFMITGKELYMNCSIGISIHPSDGDSAELLFKKADIALHAAKERGRDNCQFYSVNLDKKVSNRLELENSLRRAIERHEFRLLYQPQLDLRTGEITGAEALIRWEHPTLGLVSPADFIPIAEETGLIVPIGEWVLSVACMQNKQWQKVGLPPLCMAVNLSARQFQQVELISSIARILAKTGVDSSNLELELTESIIMQNIERSVHTLRALHAMGVKLSIDDFGTGYSSLGYLKRFPLSTLKIDRSFVHDITTDPDAASIAKAIISMAHSLKLEVVAEGVETQPQLTFLRSQHCDKMQGFLFSRPIAAEEFEQMVLEGRRLPV
ncbi:MAG: EAL domain-containing protein [Candidatus Omnitrophica bacterium]|nr:EAL domain-containing protein [Candidatus Omnitrophota bacterium]